MEELEMSRPNMTLELTHPPLLEQKDLKRPHRLKLWEIEHFFKCPVMGICLTSSEQRQVLKKAGISFKHRSPFETHEILVGGTEKKGRLSEKMDNLLNRKFGSEIAPLMHLDEKTFMERWETYFLTGEYAAALWAAATRPHLSIQSRRKIFGTIHMAMHENREQSARLRRQLAFHQEKSREMTLKARKAASTRKSLQKENIRLQKTEAALLDQLAAHARENEKLKQDLSTLKEGPIIARLERAKTLLKEERDALAAKITEKDEHIAALAEMNSRLSAEIDRQRELSAGFQKEARELVKAVFTHNRCDASCPSFDLCKKRVLIVGGLTKMESFYRQMIEDSGGIFEYHDGYMKSGMKKLESRLRRADIVLCPTNCNSHAACSLVKNLGKKHNKPVCILASSSLSAMAEALSGNGGVYASGN